MSSFRGKQRAEHRETPREPFAYVAGDTAILFCPGIDEHLMQVRIIKSYGSHKMTNADGKEAEQAGYVVMVMGEEVHHFAPAHMLRDMAHRPSHIRVAVAN